MQTVFLQNDSDTLKLIASNRDGWINQLTGELPDLSGLTQLKYLCACASVCLLPSHRSVLVLSPLCLCLLQPTNMTVP